MIRSGKVRQLGHSACMGERERNAQKVLIKPNGGQSPET
jgi:hypothetical protein